MKNSKIKIFGAFLLSLSILSIGINGNSHANGTKGAHEVLQETDKCGSGVMRFCHGNGSLCELTIDWDCLVPE